jgi:XapX domain-containing protein
VLKIVLGFVLGFAIGAGCRWFGVPAPMPPTLLGACLVVSMTLGYLAVDRAMTSGSAPGHSASASGAERR